MWCSRIQWKWLFSVFNRQQEKPPDAKYPPSPPPLKKVIFGHSMRRTGFYFHYQGSNSHTHPSVEARSLYLLQRRFYALEVRSYPRKWRTLGSLEEKERWIKDKWWWKLKPQHLLYSSTSQGLSCARSWWHSPQLSTTSYAAGSSPRRPWTRGIVKSQSWSSSTWINVIGFSWISHSHELPRETGQPRVRPFLPHSLQWVGYILFHIKTWVIQVYSLVGHWFLRREAWFEF